MFSRKNNDSQGLSLPEEWQEQTVAMLNQNFESFCKHQNKSFDVYGELFNDEILVIVSWLDNDHQEHATPISCFLSADVFKKDESEKILQDLVELASVFFDDYFQTKDWNEFEPNWLKTEYKKSEYYYKITRENIALSIQASKLLDEDNKKNQ